MKVYLSDGQRELEQELSEECTATAWAFFSLARGYLECWAVDHQKTVYLCLVRGMVAACNQGYFLYADDTYRLRDGKVVRLSRGSQLLQQGLPLYGNVELAALAEYAPAALADDVLKYVMEETRSV